MEAVYRAGFLLVLGFMGFVFWNDLFGVEIMKKFGFSDGMLRLRLP